MIAKGNKRVTITISEEAFIQLNKEALHRGLTKSELLESRILFGNTKYGSRKFINALLIEKLLAFIPDDCIVKSFSFRYKILDDSFLFTVYVVNKSCSDGLELITGTIDINGVTIDD